MNNCKYIKAIGIELEGGWNRGKNVPLTIDTSVSVLSDYVGEAVSPVIEDIMEMEDWVKTYYPDATNETCSMHVHVSFKDVESYARLADEEFLNFLIQNLRTWGESRKIIKNHPFWKRLNGDAAYASLYHFPDQQIFKIDKHGERYTAINYAWSRFKTVEFRILPAFKNVKIALDALYTLFLIIETYIDLNKEELKEKLTLFKIDEDIELLSDNNWSVLIKETQLPTIDLSIKTKVTEFLLTKTININSNL